MSFQGALESLRAAQKPSLGDPGVLPAGQPASGPLRGCGGFDARADSKPGNGDQCAAVGHCHRHPRGSAAAVVDRTAHRWLVGGRIRHGLCRWSAGPPVWGQVRAGEWLDHTIDCIKTVSLPLAVAISWFRFPQVDSDYALLIPLGYAVVASVSFFGLIIMPTLRPRPSKSAAGAEGEAWWRKFALLPTDYGFLCLAFLFAGISPLFYWIYTGFFVLNACALVLALRKWWRELVVLDRAT